MTNPLTFHFTEDPVRVLVREGEPWFVAGDISAILGYKRQQDMARNLDEDEKGVQIVHSLGGDQEMTIISESGLYHAIFAARRAEAKAFRRWVTKDVLPTLRRTGTYTMPNFQDAKQIAYDSADLSSSVAAVREARRLSGPAAARRVWEQLGLPSLGAAHDIDRLNDPLVPNLQEYLSTVDATTIDEACEAIGLNNAARRHTYRVGALLRAIGWRSRKVKRGRRTINLFTRQENIHVDA